MKVKKGRLTAVGVSGTFLNDLRVPHGQKVRLKAGDVIRIGDSIIPVGRLVIEMIFAVFCDSLLLQ